MSKPTRIAIIDQERCKPKKCQLQCKRSCPRNDQGYKCVEIEDMRTAKIAESLCIGCGLCAKACPFNAISIVKLPSELPKERLFQYGENSFRLYRLPEPKKGKVVGLLGPNGIGKSTIIRLLSGYLRPNFGLFDAAPPTTKQILTRFKGSVTHKYLTSLYSGRIKTNIKIQSIESIKHRLEDEESTETVRQRFETTVSDPELRTQIINRLDITNNLDSTLQTLSGGELQRVLCGLVAGSDGDMFIFDEPTNYLDVSQRLKMGELIRQVAERGKYVILVEHDISVLDFVSDYVCLVYGHPGAYGVVSHPQTTAHGINSFFKGYIRSENVRFRTELYQYRLGFETGMKLSYEDDNGNNNNAGKEKEKKKKEVLVKTGYDGFTVTYPGFCLTGSPGSYKNAAGITVMLGRNGTGKTSFLNHIVRSSDSKTRLGFKPQHPKIKKFKKKSGRYPTVDSFLHSLIGKQMASGLFVSDVVEPLNIKTLMKKRLNHLSGGELQRVVTVATLGMPADLYLLDEPSACLDVEQRAAMTKVIRNFAHHQDRHIFVVEHDVVMALSLAADPAGDVILFTESGIEDGVRKTAASSPVDFTTGINRFLEDLNISFRRDPENMRPRINRRGSVRDTEQKRAGNYFATR